VLYTRATYMRSVLLFTLGAVAGAAAVGGACGAMGVPIVALGKDAARVSWSIAVIAASIYGVAELSGVRLPVPTRHWQVPQAWARHGAPAFAATFGVLLGAGFFTIVDYLGYYLLLGRCALSASPSTGVAFMAAFGAARAAPIALAPILSWLRGRHYDYAKATELNNWLITFDPHMRLIRGVTLLGFAGSSIAAGVLRG